MGISRKFYFLYALIASSSIYGCRNANFASKPLGELVDSFQYSYDSSNRFWGESILTRSYGDVLCEAHTITALSTRIFTNYLDHEFYCRDVKKKARSTIYLNWQA